MVRRATTRRTFLTHAGIAVGVAGLAGCTGIGTNGQPTGTDTTTAATASPEPTRDRETPDADRRETVTFQSTADTRVTGTVYGGSACGAVMVPQINLDRESWRPQAERLARMGHTALAIDEDPDNRAESALGALRYLRQEEGVERVLFVGASSGGEAVVRANARATSGVVQGVVTLSAGGGTEAAEQLRGQKLFVVSENDDERFVRVAKQLHENAPDPKELQIYSGSAHGQGLFETKHADNLLNRLFGIVEDVCNG